MTKPFLCALALAATATFAQADSHMTAMTEAGEMAHMSAEIVVGDLALTHPFTRATLPNAPVAGGFIVITNNGAVDDRLISAASPVSNDTQIHEMAMENDVMRMRQLPEGLTIAAGETVTLAPGGNHMMFLDLTGPLVEGESIDVRLTFEVAGDVDVKMPVGATNQKSMMHGDMDMDAGHAPKATE